MPSMHGRFSEMGVRIVLFFRFISERCLSLSEYSRFFIELICTFYSTYSTYDWMLHFLVLFMAPQPQLRLDDCTWRTLWKRSTSRLSFSTVGKRNVWERHIECIETSLQLSAVWCRLLLSVTMSFDCTAKLRGLEKCSWSWVTVCVHQVCRVVYRLFLPLMVIAVLLLWRCYFGFETNVRSLHCWS